MTTRRDSQPPAPDFAGIQLFLSCVGLAEFISCVGNRKRAVRLRRDFDPVRNTIVLRWRRRSGPRCRRWNCGDWHTGWLVIDQIGDEHSRNCIFLAAQLWRKVHLPKVLETGRGINYLHHFGCTALARAIVQQCYSRMKSVDRRSLVNLESANPWCETISTSVVPSGLFGHMRASSLFQVRSPI